MVQPEGRAAGFSRAQTKVLIPCNTQVTPSEAAQKSQPLTHLLLVIRRVRQHRGHVKHDLMVLVSGVERVCARGIRCGQTVGDTKRTWVVRVTSMSLA